MMASGERRGEDPSMQPEIRVRRVYDRRYTEELSQGAARSALGHVAALAAAGPVTLLTATRDVDHSQAAALAQLLRHQALSESAEGGDAACWAHLVCPECGAITTGGHRPDCASA